MQLDFGTKQQIDNRHVTRRINNEGRLIGSRVRHVTWLHTYHKRGLIDPFQFHAGYKLGYLWNRGTIILGAKTVNMASIALGSICSGEIPASVSEELRRALTAVQPSNRLEAVIDLSVFDMNMGKKRMYLAKDGLTMLAEHFRVVRNAN